MTDGQQKHIRISEGQKVQFDYPFFTTTDEKDKPLLEAVIHHDIVGIDLALKRRANVNAQNDELQTALHFAVEDGSIAVLLKLLSYPAIKINLRNQYGFTPLWIATWHNNFDTVDILLQHGAKPNVKCRFRNTALHAAVTSENYSIVKLLLGNGAKIDAVNCFGETPLKKAIELINIRIVNLLFLKRASFNDKFLHLVHLMLSVRNLDDFARLMKLLVVHGINLNAAYEISEKTILHFSAMKGDIRVVRILMKYGADPFALDKFDNCPLVYAIDFQNHLIASYIINEMKRAIYDNRSLPLTPKFKKIKYKDLLK